MTRDMPTAILQRNWSETGKGSRNAHLGVNAAQLLLPRGRIILRARPTVFREGVSGWSGGKGSGIGNTEGDARREYRIAWSKGISTLELLSHGQNLDYFAADHSGDQGRFLFSSSGNHIGD